MIDAISHLLERPVAYHPVLAKALKSVPAAVMLSQGIYWQRIAEREGNQWFWVTNHDWYEQTGITVEMQQTARKTLKNAGVWKEKLMGVPAKMHYQINVESLVAVISRYLETGISVTVDYRNKKRLLPRTGNGKFRQQDAVENGNIIETIKDSEEIRREYAPAPEKTASLKTEEKKDLAKAPAPPAPAAPPWDAYPKANTPDELLTALRGFYFPDNKPAEHWRVLIDATPAMNWTAAKQKEVVSNFCDWALSEGWERRTFRQINSRLKRWFKDEPLMAKQKQPGGPAKPSVEPAGRAYQPYQL